MNDREATELILKAYQQPLSDDEARSLERYLQQSEPGREFAKLSQAIQDAIQRLAFDQVDDPQSPIEGLSDSVRNQMQQAVLDALAKRSDRPNPTRSGTLDSTGDDRSNTPVGGGAMLAAENPPDYQKKSPPPKPPESPGG